MLASGALLSLAAGCKITSSSLGGDQGGGGASSGETGSGGANPYGPCPAKDSLDSTPGTPCDRPHQLICAYQFNDGWEAAGCSCDTPGKWTVFDGRAHDPSQNCPLNSPEQHSTCGVNSVSSWNCQYLDDDLVCSCMDHRWECRHMELPAEVLKCAARLDPPFLDESKLVGDLTDDERATWCQWFGDSFPGSTTGIPSDGAVHADGTVSSYPTTACGPLCAERLSLDHCEANLKLYDCKATVKQLDDCWMSFSEGCMPATGCDAFHAQPGCDQTIFVPGETGLCKIPVQ